MTEENWAAQEFAGSELGDKRREKRLIRVVEQRAKRPNASLTVSSEDKAGRKAAYRLLDNEAVGAEAILEGHYQASLQRARGEAIVLAVQDTMYLNYSSHPATSGLGYLQNLEMRGILVHTTLLITPQRLPLGLIDQQVWARKAEDFQVKRKESGALRTAQKESQKWLVSLAATARVQKQLGEQTQVINIGDSKADVYDLLRKAVELHQALIIRAAYDRNVDHGEKHLRAYLKQQDLAGNLLLQVPRTAGKPARTANLAIRFASVTLCPPTNRYQEALPKLTLWGILTHEIDAPSGEKALDWLLLTNVPIETFAQAKLGIDWYTCRWGIETYHKILKSGCRVEQRQFGDAENLQRYLAIDAVVAWRVFFLTMLARAVPDLPCTTILEAYEWQALYSFVYKSTQLPQRVPTLHQAIFWIAQLGGFLARKSDGPPGPISLWRGIQRLADIADAWLIFHPP